MTLLVFQITLFCMILPMSVLGVMVGLSGGGSNPTFQKVGQLLMVASPVIGILSVLVSIIFSRVGVPIVAYTALCVPIIFWVVLLIWLQRDTKFFF